MIELTPQSIQFKTQCQDLLTRRSASFRTIEVPRHAHIYTSGTQDPMIYFIMSGQVKLVLATYGGDQSLLAIALPGDLIGESCLFGQVGRLETAVAMQDVTLKKIHHRDFINILHDESMLEGLVQHLSSRISEQQEFIAAMVTNGCEQRLAKALLGLGRRSGRDASDFTCLDFRISQTELAEMIGTTRTRISKLMNRLRNMGLIWLSDGHRIMIDEARLEHYISSRW